MSVEPESKLPGRAVVIEVLNPGRPFCSLDRVFGIYTVLERRRMNSHAEASASRITSERDLPSRSARASRALISSAVRRNAMTCDGSAPRPGRPRPRFFNAATSYPASASAAQAAICSSVMGVPLIVSGSLMPLMLYENKAPVGASVATTPVSNRVANGAPGRCDLAPRFCPDYVGREHRVSGFTRLSRWPRSNRHLCRDSSVTDVAIHHRSGRGRTQTEHLAAVRAAGFRVGTGETRSWGRASRCSRGRARGRSEP